MGRGPFFYHAVAPINNGWLHYQPKQQCTIHGKSLKTTFFFHSLNLWFPKQMGSHWPPTFLEGKNSTTNKFPARPRGQLPPSKTSRPSIFPRPPVLPPGPPVQSLTWTVQELRNATKGDRWNAVVFGGWTLVKKTMPSIWDWYGYIYLDLLPWLQEFFF